MFPCMICNGFREEGPQELLSSFVNILEWVKLYRSETIRSASEDTHNSIFKNRIRRAEYIVNQQRTQNNNTSAHLTGSFSRKK